MLRDVREVLRSAPDLRADFSGAVEDLRDLTAEVRKVRNTAEAIGTAILMVAVAVVVVLAAATAALLRVEQR